jgi:hypothetical protein
VSSQPSVSSCGGWLESMSINSPNRSRAGDQPEHFDAQFDGAPANSNLCSARTREAQPEKRYILCRIYLNCHTSCANLSNQMERAIDDLTGRKFGRWMVLPRDDIESNYRRRKWLVQCECGNLRLVIGQDLLNGRSASCGCSSRQKNTDLHARRKRTKRIVFCRVPALRAHGRSPRRASFDPRAGGIREWRGGCPRTGSSKMKPGPANRPVGWRTKRNQGCNRLRKVLQPLT